MGWPESRFVIGKPEGSVVVDDDGMPCWRRDVAEALASNPGWLAYELVPVETMDAVRAFIDSCRGVPRGRLWDDLPNEVKP